VTSLYLPSSRLNGDCTSRRVSASAFGLVPSPTSDTHPPDAFEIDRRENRLRRMSKGVKTGARLHQQEAQQGGRRVYTVMITCTYREDADYKPRHVSHLIKCVREWHRRRGLRMRYVWVLELTKRGRPHYHLLLWLPRGYRLPKPDKRGWWPHGSTKIEGARSPVGYVAKYASKLTTAAQGELQRVFRGLPKGARLHGCGGLMRAGASERRWWLSPGWVRKAWPCPSDDPRPAPGGGWVSRLTGAWLSSPWRVILQGSRVFVAPRSLGPEWWAHLGLPASGGASRSDGPPDAGQALRALEQFNAGGVRYAM